MLNATILRSCFAAALTLAGAVLFAVPSHAPAFEQVQDQMITLPAGTVVNLSLNEAIMAEDLSVGNSLDFFVRSNVTVNGQVVIAAGATATGWVKSVKRASNGQASEITITVENVSAVDGQTINLRSIPHIVKMPAGAGNAEANIGTNLSARVLNNVTINA